MADPHSLSGKCQVVVQTLGLQPSPISQGTWPGVVSLILLVFVVSIIVPLELCS